jgi:hypothetical protein
VNQCHRALMDGVGERSLGDGAGPAPEEGKEGSDRRASQRQAGIGGVEGREGVGWPSAVGA